MKFFLPILMFLVILATIFNLSMGLKCHVCFNSLPKCTARGGGPMEDCIKYIDEAVACGTTIYSNGVFNRGCLNKWGLGVCRNASKQQIPQKCKDCNTDSCNIEDRIP